MSLIGGADVIARLVGFDSLQSACVTRLTGLGPCGGTRGAPSRQSRNVHPTWAVNQSTKC